MRFDIITVLPGLLESPFAHSILQRAQSKGLSEIVVHNLRDYSNHKQKSVDDYQYGGGSGMVMTIEPFANCIEKLKSERDYDEVIFMTPDGATLNQTTEALKQAAQDDVIKAKNPHERFLAQARVVRMNSLLKVSKLYLLLRLRMSLSGKLSAYCNHLLKMLFLLYKVEVTSLQVLSKLCPKEKKNKLKNY